MAYTVQKAEKFSVYNADNIRIFCGDYFDLDASHLSEVDAVYDRGSLIALLADLRVIYAQHLHTIILNGCRVLLLTLPFFPFIFYANNMLLFQQNQPSLFET
jgi:thiopurine S-methyltransferase